MIAKEVVQAQEEATKYYELLEEGTATGLDGEEIAVLNVVGKVSLEGLTSQKESLEAQIVEIDAKIAAIGELTK